MKLLQKNVEYLFLIGLFWLSCFCMPENIVLAQTCSPTLFSSYPTVDEAQGVFVSGSTAYVADRDSGLQIIDVSNPADPVHLGSFVDTKDFARGVFVTGSTAYVADGEAGGLQIIDVSDPTAPALLGSIDTPGAAFSVCVSGSTAYVADLFSGLQIIDVSDPTAPALLGSFDTPDRAFDVFVSDSTAYVADFNGGLQIIDVSAPAAPVLLGSFDTPDRARGVFVSGKTAYVADFDSGLQIINVSDPTTPVLLGSFDTPDRARGVFVSSRAAYVADGTVGGLQIIDVSDPAAPVLLGSFDTPGRAFDVFVLGATAYVTDVVRDVGESSLQIIDASDCDCATTYAKGKSFIRFDDKETLEDKVSLSICVTPTFCDALKAGPEEIVIGVNNCNKITIPGDLLQPNYSMTKFRAESSKFKLKIDCREGKGWLKLILKEIDLENCITDTEPHNVKTCVSITNGPCTLCAEQTFEEKRDYEGMLEKLILKIRDKCSP